MNYIMTDMRSHDDLLAEIETLRELLKKAEERIKELEIERIKKNSEKYLNIWNGEREILSD